MAHLYSGVLADAIAGYRRLAGENAAAISLICGEESPTNRDLQALYQETWQAMGLNVRAVTYHRSEQVMAGNELWQAWKAAGDLYVGRYDGWHCAACQQFYAHHEVQDGPSCPIHLLSVTKVHADCWFFRLSGYTERLREFMDRVQNQGGRPFVMPARWMDRIRARLVDGLVDVPLLSAGIPGRESGHDAGETRICAPLLALTSSWTNSSADLVYVVPDEAIWLCALAWPAMLMAAGCPSPIGVVAVDSLLGGDTQARPADWLRLHPKTVADGLGADALRYLVLRWPAMASRNELSTDALLDRHTVELAKGLGNLVARTSAMAANSDLGGKVPHPEVVESPFESEIRASGTVERPDPEGILDDVNSLVRAGNAFVDERRPWDQAPSDRAVTLWHALELCRVIGHLIAPVFPERSQKLLGQLGVAERSHWPSWGGYQPAFGVNISSEPLFSLVASASRHRLLAAWAKELEKGSPRVEILTEDFSKFDLRVARIAAAEPISTDGGSLLKLTLDLGVEHRVVFSTKLAKSFTSESIVGLLVTYLANLEPIEIAGFVSQGMVLAVVDGEKSSLLTFDRTHEPGMVMF